MTPRRRKADRTNWPKGLYQKTLRGKERFFYRFRDKTEEYFDEELTEIEAIQLGRMLEKEDRSPELIRQEKVANKDPFNIPMSEAIARVKQKVQENQELGREKWRTFELDCDRFLTLFSDLRTYSYNDRHVNEFLQTFVLDEGKSNGVYNRKLDFLRKVEKWLRDMSLIKTLHAQGKAKLKQQEKREQPLQLEQFQAIYRSPLCPQYLKVAMALSFQTTHAVQEISKATYKRCEYFDKPVVDPVSGLLVFGYLRIHRLKVEKHLASRVEIPITAELDHVIKLSRSDDIVSPYIVHDAPPRGVKPSRECDHWTQCSRGKISKKFSEVRDALDLDLMVPNPNKRRGSDDPDYIKVKMRDASPDQRPGFHQIRGLAMRLVAEAGVDPQSRAAHTDGRSTKIYTDNKIEWTRVPAVNIRF